MSGINPLNLFGVNPNSQYAQLFVDIFHLTKMKLDLRRSNEALENVSDSEDGEIDECFNDQHDRISFDFNSGNGGGSGFSNNNSHNQELMDWNGNPNKLLQKKKIKKKFASGGTNSKFLTDLESQFNIDKSPDRLEWMQCYLGKIFLLFMHMSGFTPSNNSS